MFSLRLEVTQKAFFHLFVNVFGQIGERICQYWKACYLEQV